MKCALCGSIDIASRQNAFVLLCRECRTPQIHKEAHRYHGQVKRAERAGALPSLTFREWITILNYFEWKCAYCKDKPFTLMEHIVSLSKGGETVANNIVPACSKCNKHKDMPDAKIYGNLMSDAVIERVKQELAMALRTL